MEPMRAQLKIREICRRKMFNSRVKIVFLLVLSGCLLSACAQVKEAGRTIGRLGMLQQLLVMGLVTALKLLVRE
jgi:hypothetical protein